MKGLSFIFIASFLAITSSCSNSDPYEGFHFGENTKQIVFFSDDSNYTQEAPYYDAIVELKKEFPHEFENMIVLTGDKGNKYGDLFDVSDSPAIIIYYNDNVLVKINGNVTKEQITQPLSTALSSS